MAFLNNHFKNFICLPILVFQNADRLIVFKGHGKFMNRADAPAAEKNRVSRAGQKNVPPASLAPMADQSGKPVVAPVTKTAPCFTISAPSSLALSSALGPQWPVSA